jgi:hypothetical protein
VRSLVAAKLEQVVRADWLYDAPRLRLAAIKQRTYHRARKQYWEFTHASSHVAGAI